MCVDKNIRRGVFTVAVSLLWGIVSATPFSQANHSLVKDPEIEAADFQHIDEKKIIDQYLKLPEISSPMGFTPDMMNKVSLANPAEKVGLIQPPYPNNQGDLRLTYPLEFTPARIQPSVGISYSSRFETRNMGEGWNFDVSHISLDTIRYKNPQEAQELVTCLVDGVRYVSAVQACEGDSLFYYPETDPASSFLVRYEKEMKHYFWKLFKRDGSVYYFDWRSFSDDDTKNDVDLCDGSKCMDNGSRLTDEKKAVAGEWYVTRQEDYYGNYVDFVYESVSNRPYLDTIFVGNRGIEEPHSYYTFSYDQYTFTDKVESYGFESTYGKKLVSMKVFFLKDEVDVHEIKHDTKPYAKTDLYAPLRSYTFNYYPLSKYDLSTNTKEPEDQRKTLLRSITQNSAETVNFAVHKFDYYYDTELIEDRMNYVKYMKQDPDAKDVTPYLVDRTNKLRNIHNPLGGCFSIDYDWMYYKVPDLTVEENATVQEISMKDAEDLDEKFVKHLLVMNYLRIHDGVLDKGYNTNNTFTYEGGLWGKDTSWFHGFAKVTNINNNATLGDDPFHDDLLYRSWIKEYGIDRYATESLLTKVTLLNAKGKELKKIELSYAAPVAYASNKLYFHENTTPQKEGNELYFVHVMDKTVTDEDGNLQTLNYDYDISDNLFENYYSPLFVYEYYNGSKTKTLFFCTQGLSKDHRTRFMPNQINLYDKAANNPYATYDIEYKDKNNLMKPTSLKESFFNRQMSRKVNYEYDKDGNMTHIIYPKDVNDDQMKVDFLYDRRFNMYLNRIDNSLGYRTELEDFDYRYGVAKMVVDRNGVRMTRELDDMGRVKKILAPNEIETQSPYTIKFDYLRPASLEEIPDYVYFEDQLRAQLYLNKGVESFREDVLTNNFANVLDAVSKATGMDADKICTSDWTYPEEAIVDDINADAVKCFCADQAKPIYALTTRNQAKGHNTYVFVDGFGRVIQSKDQRLVATDQNPGNAGKHDFTESEMYLVSGKTVYDGFGREILRNSYLMEEKGDEKVFTAKSSETLALSQSFDELDRVVSAEDLTNQYTYKYAMSDEGEYKMAQIVVDNNDKKHSVETRYDLGGNLTYKSSMDYYRALWRGKSYSYDPLNHLTSINGEGISIQYTYDDLGRIKTKTDNGNETQFSYDKAGNLLSETRPDGTSVTYAYKLGQLKTIEYKKGDISEVVRLDYGKANAKFNRVGLLCYVQDATGVQELYYDKMGGISKIRKSIVAPNKEIETYEMKWDHDSWNHLTQVVYPDQEKVSYSYNLNGLVTSVTGAKSYTYNYAQSMGYDELGNLVHIRYNNGDDNYFSYQPQSNDMEYASVFSETKNDDVFGTKTMDAYSSTYFVNDVLVNHSISSVDTWGRIWDATGDYTDLASNSKYSYDVKYNYAGWKRTSSNEIFIYDGDVYKTLQKSIKYNYEEPGSRYLSSVAYSEQLGGQLQSVSLDVVYDQNNNVIEEGLVKHAYDFNNRLLGVVDNGYVSVYFNDAFGNNIVSVNGGGENVYVNSEWQQGDNTISSNFPFRLNEYFEIDADSNYYKHILLDDKVLVTKLGNHKSYGENARREVRAGADYDGEKPDYRTMYDQAYDKLALTYGLLKVPFKMEKLEYKEPQNVMLRSSNIGLGNDECEPTQYYYHWLSGGRLVYLSDLNGDVTEVVMQSPEGLSLLATKPIWSTPYRTDKGFYDVVHQYIIGKDGIYDPKLGIKLNEFNSQTK